MAARTRRRPAQRRSPARRRPPARGGTFPDFGDLPPMPRRSSAPPSRQGRGPLVKIVTSVLIVGALYASGARVDWPLGAHVASATGRGAQKAGGYLGDKASDAAGWIGDALHGMNEKNNAQGGN